MIIFVNILFVSIFIFELKQYLHIYQLKDYQAIRYLKFFKSKIIFNYLIYIFILILQITIKNDLIFIILNIFLLIFYLLINKNIIKSQKTPLKYTSKIKHLFFIIILISLILIPFKYAVSSLCLLSLLLPIIADFINIYDKIKNKIFISAAQKKLKLFKPKIIAITGSNGKTSVKNILCEMLSYQYKTQATPHSYNTPLGISKFINNDLKSDTEFLIVEYGARHKNDIKTLCKLFGADFGIITTIAPQHLESFKTIENVCIAKNELSKYLKNNVCVFNLDNIFTRKMFAEKDGEKISISTDEIADVFAEKITFENFKTKFILCCNNEKFTITTSLLGIHNVSNILLSTALALHLKVDTNNILKAIKNLKPTKHRLEYIKGYLNILDDSYNCSLSSATEAIKILNQTQNQKMIITPGIIECGKQQYDINFKLGQMCADFDFVVIVGNYNKKAILDGLKSLEFKHNIIVANSLEQATQQCSKLTSQDCVLFLNDLPDDYG